MGQQNIIEILPKLEEKFMAQNSYGLKFAGECLFAKQLLTKSNYALQTAQNNPQSVRNAILNVAAIGISLNPALAHAYLVPRDGGICLDISYKGLVKLSTDSGAIEWAKAVLVYKNDDFEMNGTWEPPTHKYNPFSKERGELTGGYCVAKLTTGDYMTDTMSADEIYKVRDTSKAYLNAVSKNKSDSVWHLWFEEMAKKTLIKRASKSWPQSNGRERLDNAIEVLNEHEGIETAKVIEVSDYLQASPEQKEKFLELTKGDCLDLFVWYNPLDERIKMSVMDHEFERGQKGKLTTMWRDMLVNGREKLENLKADLQSCCDAEDETGVNEILSEFDQPVIDALMGSLNVQQANFAASHSAVVNEA